MRLGETGPRERRRWGGFLMDTDMTEGEERREMERGGEKLRRIKGCSVHGKKDVRGK